MATVTADQIFAFVRLRTPNVQTFLITPTKSGVPNVRRVGAFVEDGWVVGVMSAQTAAKIQHIERNPVATVLWVDTSAENPTRNVMISGPARVVRDVDEINAFLKRRSEIYPIPYRPMTGENPQYLISVQANLVRAEAFIEGDRTTPAVIRDVAAGTVEIVEPHW